MEVAFIQFYVLIDACSVMAYFEHAIASICGAHEKVIWYHFSEFVTVRTEQTTMVFFTGNYRGSQSPIENKLFQRFFRDFPSNY